MKKIYMLFLAIVFSFSAIASTEITLTSDNALSLKEDFNSASVAALIEKATKLDANLKSGYPIYLVLYTPGGDVDAGLELYDYLSGLNRPIHTITVFAASMGFQTVQHLGKRYITRYGTLMSHKARGRIGGEFGGGYSQLDSRYGLWLRLIKKMDEQTVKRTNGKQTLQSYSNAYAPELWLIGDEAVKQGYADDVAIVKCGVSLRGHENKDFDLGFFKVTAKMSKCPTNTSPIGMSASLFTNKGEMTLRAFLLKNGKFGKKCGEGVSFAKDYVNSFYSEEFTSSTDRDDLDTKISKSSLCALDPSLTLEKIKKAMKEKQKFLNRDLKNHIKYSY